MAAAAAFVALVALGGRIEAQQPATPVVSEVAIGYVDLLTDARYDPDYAYNMVPVRPLGRAFSGAELSIADAAVIGRAINVTFTTRRAIGANVDDLATAIGEWVREGVHFVVADLGAADILALSDRVAGLPVTLLNISAYEDRLRAEDCRANVVHIIPSTRMLTDAMVQFLVSRRWRNILVLQGPAPEDQATVDALRQSAALFGARIVDVRPFILSNDPRNRERSNVALVTAGATYDVVYVADVDGEFARYVPYQTNDPRPVVGSAGLVASAWHWSWERQGAPQLNARFEALAERRMADVDWAAWVAVRSVVQSVLRSQSVGYDAVRGYLLGERLTLDGYKANPMNVRPWDHQLRQAIVVATGNAVMQLAPVEGFVHQTNDLDTLGVDEPNTRCRF